MHNCSCSASVHFRPPLVHLFIHWPTPICSLVVHQPALNCSSTRRTVHRFVHLLSQNRSSTRRIVHRFVHLLLQNRSSTRRIVHSPLACTSVHTHTSSIVNTENKTPGRSSAPFFLFIFLVHTLRTLHVAHCTLQTWLYSYQMLQWFQNNSGFHLHM